MSLEQSTQVLDETQEIPDWELKRHHLPQLIASDSIISNMERLIWEKEYKKHLFTNDGDVNAIVRSPDYQDPLAQQRNIILGVRNEIARRIGVKERGIHEFTYDALGYRTEEDHVFIGDRSHQIDQSEMHMIKMR